MVRCDISSTFTRRLDDLDQSAGDIIRRIMDIYVMVAL